MYVKLFTSIYQGTLRGNAHGLLVFTNLLAHADKDGCADIHPRAIAEEVGLSIEAVQAALEELESPDPESRSPEHDGRRIIRLDEHRAWGWHIVNYVKYRAIRDEADRREQNRLAQERYRARNQSKPASAKVSQGKPQSAHTEADTEADIGSTNVDPLVWAEFVEHRKAIRKPLGKLSAQKNLNILAAMTPADQRRAVDATIANNWTGIFPPKGNANGTDNRHSGPLSAVDRVKAAAAARAASDPNY